ncbi:hypothetical protein AgCh_024602 [Apium graveolens]
MNVMINRTLKDATIQLHEGIVQGLPEVKIKNQIARGTLSKKRGKWQRGLNVELLLAAEVMKRNRSYIALMEARTKENMIRDAAKIAAMKAAELGK